MEASITVTLSSPLRNDEKQAGGPSKLEVNLVRQDWLHARGFTQHQVQVHSLPSTWVTRTWLQCEIPLTASLAEM